MPARQIALTDLSSTGRRWSRHTVHEFHIYLSLQFPFRGEWRTLSQRSLDPGNNSR